MNKILYALSAVFLLTSSTQGQIPGLWMKGQGDAPLHTIRMEAAPVPAWYRQGQRAAFWAEDFSGGGIPAGWTNEDAMTPSNQTQVLFQWSNDPAAVQVAAVNQPLILNFLAPGASNGYLWANSDRGLVSGPGSNHLTRLTTSPIDCSGQSTVLFTMRSTIGVWDNDANQYCKLRVSTDGDTWTDFSPFPCLTAGGDIAPPCSRFSYNPQFVAIDITSVAANQPAVYLQLQWQGGWEYYWAIDDLELSSVPENELVLDFGYTSQADGGYEFGRIPQAQMPNSMAVGAQVVNFGSNAQTNTAVEITLWGPDGSQVATTTSPIGNMSQGDTVMVESTLLLNDAPQTGLYRADFTVTSDQSGQDEDPWNNTNHRYFEVTEHTYSLDGIGVLPDSLLVVSQTGTTSFVDNTVDVRFLTFFEVRTPATFDAVEVALGSNTSPGSYLMGELHEAGDVLNGDLSSPLAASDIRVVAQDDMDAGGIVRLEFFDPVELGTGRYYVSANLYQEGGNNIYVMDDISVQQPNDASLLWISNDENSVHLYSNGTAWSVRPLMQEDQGEPDGIDVMNGPGGVMISPNPSTGLFWITLDQPHRAHVEVFDMTGALVQASDFTGSMHLDMGSKEAGMYTVRISAGDRHHVRRITVQ